MNITLFLVGQLTKCDMWILITIALIILGFLIYLAFSGKNSNKTKKDELDGSIEKLSAEMAEKIIYSVPDMIFIVDKDYKIRRVLNCDPNKLSVPANAIVGLALYDAVDKECVASVISALDRALANDDVQEIVYSITFKDSIQYFEGRFKRIQQGLVACFERNITGRKETEEKIDKMQRINQLILDNANSGLVYINTEFIVQWENVGRHSDNVLASKYKEGVCCYQAVMGRNEPCEDCIALKSLDSKKVEQEDRVIDDELCIAITASPVFDEWNMPLGVVLKYDDTTARRKVAEELRLAKEAAETSDKLKSIFISNMSHEIRTPLNAIVGFSDLLSLTDDPDDKREFVSIIKRNNELLLQLVNDILDLSKIEADMLEFVYSDVNVRSLFRDLEMNCSFGLLPGSGVKLSFILPSEDYVIHTEENRIQQVLMNLINNAFKFTKKGEVCVGCEYQDAGMRFFVSDTGKGIPEDKQEEIFRRFVKLDNFISGTGLGLSICQTIIQKLGGEIGVDSTEGSGSTFWFTLPVSYADRKQKADLSVPAYRL